MGELASTELEDVVEVNCKMRVQTIANKAFELFIDSKYSVNELECLA